MNALQRKVTFALDISIEKKQKQKKTGTQKIWNIPQLARTLKYFHNVQCIMNSEVYAQSAAAVSRSKLMQVSDVQTEVEHIASK